MNNLELYATLDLYLSLEKQIIMISQAIFRKEDFTVIGQHVLIKVILKPEKGLVRNKRNKISNYVFGFVSEKTHSQDLFIRPRSWDDQITHNIIDGDPMPTPDDSEFFVWFNDIEWFFASTY